MFLYLAPTKTMVSSPTAAYQELLLPDQSTLVLSALQKALKEKDIASFYRCSVAMAKKIEHLWQTFENTPPQPAWMAFDGLVFKYLDAPTMSDEGKNHARRYLRIASGLYGLLRPDDGIRPYRLDWNDPLRINGQTLSSYWGPYVAQHLTSMPIINLASKEYADPLKPHLSNQWIDIVFYERQTDGTLKNKATLAKMARGELTRLICEHELTSPEDITTLSPLKFHYQADISTPQKLVFVCPAK